jgi:hypothetical protein
MREFFRGWRRKAGLVTLVMACLVNVAWMRSQFGRDAYAIRRGNDYQVIATSRVGVLWNHKVVPENTQVIYDPGWEYSTYSENEPPDFRLHIDVYQVDWRWRLCGFDFGEYRTKGINRYWVIPYWSISLPFTLLSAYLILWKPRKRTAASTES